jgi:hypothetical protein
MTLDVYAGPFADDLDDITVRLDRLVEGNDGNERATAGR